MELPRQKPARAPECAGRPSGGDALRNPKRVTGNGQNDSGNLKIFRIFAAVNKQSNETGMQTGRTR